MRIEKRMSGLLGPILWPVLMLVFLGLLTPSSSFDAANAQAGRSALRTRKSNGPNSKTRSKRRSLSTSLKAWTVRGGLFRLRILG